MLISIARALTGIAQRAVALGVLIRSNLPNPSSSQCASEPADAAEQEHQCSDLTPTHRGSDMGCVMVGPWQCQEPACWVLHRTCWIVEVWQEMWQGCSAPQHWRRVGHSGTVSSTCRSLTWVSDTVTTAAPPQGQPGVRNSYNLVCSCGALGQTALLSCSWLRGAWREWSLGSSSPWSFTSGTGSAGCCKGSCSSTWAGQISLQEAALDIFLHLRDILLIRCFFSSSQQTNSAAGKTNSLFSWYGFVFFSLLCKTSKTKLVLALRPVQNLHGISVLLSQLWVLI